MAQIPKTQKKLREARFFCGHMSVSERSPGLDREDLDFYLSAFLAAGRTVTGFFDEKRNRQYRRWFHQCKMVLAESDRKLLNDMTSQRDAEIHEEGAEVLPEVEFVPVTEIDRGPRSSPAYGMHWGIPPPKIGTKVLYFNLRGKRAKVTTTCKRHLELLDQLVRDFESAFPRE